MLTSIGLLIYYFFGDLKLFVILSLIELFDTLNVRMIYGVY